MFNIFVSTFVCAAGRGARGRGGEGARGRGGEWARGRGGEGERGRGGEGERGRGASVQVDPWVFVDVLLLHAPSSFSCRVD